MLSTEDLQRLAEERGLTLAAKCTHDGCARPVANKNLCHTHYARSRRP